MHKKCVDDCLPFRPVLSALQTPTCKLAKYLVLILEPLTINKYTVKDSFYFATEIVEQDSSNFMGRLDTDSLFINILREESIEICTNILFKNSDLVHGLKKPKSRILYLIVYYTNKLTE